MMLARMHLATRRSMCLCILVVCLLSLCGSALAQEVKITSSPNPVGSGARALGMGGAFIAIADDATAASWNPGGLVQLERPELSVVGEGFYRTEDNRLQRHPEASGQQSVSNGSLNYLSAAYPFALLDHNMIVSLNYQHLYDFSRSWNYSYTQGSTSQALSFNADGGLYAWGLAYSVQIVPRFSFGFTLNFWEDGLYRNGWETTTNDTMTSKIPGSMRVRTYVSSVNNRYSFSGFNGNVGFLWNPTDKLSVGGVFKSPFTADLTHELRSSLTEIVPYGSGEISMGGQTKTYDEKLDMPMSYGIGMAFRFSDRLTFSTDISRTQWQDFILTQADGTRISPITNRSTQTSDIDPTTQVRVGAEYLFIMPKVTVPVRVGFFYDPAPANRNPEDFFGLSLGSGIGTHRFSFDVAYVYRFAGDVGKSLIEVQNRTFSQDVNEHSLYTSLIIYF